MPRERTGHPWYVLGLVVQVLHRDCGVQHRFECWRRAVGSTAVAVVRYTWGVGGTNANCAREAASLAHWPGQWTAISSSAWGWR